MGWLMLIGGLAVGIICVIVLFMLPGIFDRQKTGLLRKMENDNVL